MSSSRRAGGAVEARAIRRMRMPARAARAGARFACVQDRRGVSSPATRNRYRGASRTIDVGCIDAAGLLRALR
jgi:hypothetical protein